MGRTIPTSINCHDYPPNHKIPCANNIEVKLGSLSGGHSPILSHFLVECGKEGNEFMNQKCQSCKGGESFGSFVERENDPCVQNMHKTIGSYAYYAENT